MYIPRSAQTKVEKAMFKGTVVIVYGPRQSGKTTMLSEIARKLDFPTSIINCDDQAVQRLFREAETLESLRQLIGEDRVVIIDEAQRIKNIGIKLKLLIDSPREQQIIASGSSSFDLANEIVEPLTGRNTPFWVFPLSLSEIKNVWTTVELQTRLPELLTYGSYPKVLSFSAGQDKENYVKLLTSDYLYKDVLKFNSFRASETVSKLLTALALQIGNEVSFTELGNLIGVSKQTVADYVGVLEQAFVLFKLPPFSRNLRKEIGKMHKIYFYDLGVRNALIGNFNPLSARADKGAMWENFIISEFRKKQFSISGQVPMYFWRTYDQQEIDLVLDSNGKLFSYEIKWDKAKVRVPKAWREAYQGSEFEVVNKENFLEVLAEKLE